MSGIKKIEVLPLYYDYVLSTDYPVYVLVGGRNSGKSFFMQQLAAINLNNKIGYKLMVVEDVQVNIGEGVKEGIESRRRELGIDRFIKSTKVPREIVHLNGNSVIFRGISTPEREKKVKSLNRVTAVWYEEAQNITYSQFKALRMQLRGGEPADRKLFLTLNPVNREGFVSNYFFKKPPSRVFESFADGRPKVFERLVKTKVGKTQTEIKCLVIVSTHWDNPFLTRRQRADIEELKDNDKDMYAMLSEGRFIKGKGVFFPEFDYGVHTCLPFEIPGHWRRYMAFDYGLDMLACYRIALSDEGRRYVYSEIYRPDLIISQAARLIKQAMAGQQFYRIFAPPDLYNRRQETGKSAAEIFSDNGVYLTKASNDRVSGWLDLKEWLKVGNAADGTRQAGLVIFENCENLIRCLPQLQRDRANPGDVDSRTNHELTHGPDALRYFVAGRPAPAPPAVKRPVYNFESERPPTPLDMEDIVVV